MNDLLDFKPLVFDSQTILTWGALTTLSGIILVILVFFLVNRYRTGLKLRLALNYGLLLIEMPKYFLLPKDSGTTKVAEEINHFENFLNTLMLSKYPIAFEIATPHFGEEIFFYVAVPKKLIPVLQKSIRNFWPGSEVSLVEQDYNIFNPTGITLGSFVNLKSHYFKPTRTYRDIALSTNDPLDAFLAAFNKLRREGEGLAYQLIVKPLSSKENKKIKSVVDKIKQGKSFEEALGHLGREIMKELMAKPQLESEIKDKQKPLDEILVRNLEAKMSKPFFDVNIRLVVSTANAYDAEDVLSTLEAAFHQFVNPGLNEFIPTKAKGRWLREFIYQFAFRLYDKKSSSRLNTEEIASIFHWPTAFTKSPIIHWLPARSAPPPPNLPADGVVLGENLYQGNRALVRIQRPDRLRHIYVIGQTGTGKTTLLKNIAEQDMQNGDGLCFLDPHGDVAQELLGLVPRSRVEDVIYFNPGDPSRPLALNILEYDASFPEQKTFIINTLIEIIDKLYNLKLTGGPMFEQYLRNALLLIMDDPNWGHTLMEVSRVLVDQKFRRELMEKCRNYPVVEFWTKQAPVVGGELSLENMITWITSKLNPFITNDFVRPIIGQPHSTLNFKDVMDNRKILIVNLAKGKIGETSSYLMGMILVAKILAAAFSRVDQPEAERKDFYLFVDEFQNFAFKGVTAILSEARKYRLAMILAHQYIKQLPDEISSAVFGNVGTLISFRIGTEDAEVLERQFTPIFTKTDLLNIPNYTAYLKLLISGYISDAFNIRTLRPAEPNYELAQKLTEISKLKYGRPKEEIEAEIEQKYGYTKAF